MTTMISPRLARRGFLAAAAFLLASLVLPMQAQAAETSQAKAFIESLGSEALSSLTGQNVAPAEREVRVRKLLRTNFDIDTISKFALGTYWRGATDAQKKEYTSLFENMIVKTYAQRFEDYKGQTFKVTGETAANKDVIVNSQILQAGGPPVNVDWRVRGSGKNMKIIDVMVEGISMSVTQRSDFAAVIQRGGGNVDALLKSLRERSGTAAPAAAG